MRKKLHKFIQKLCDILEILVAVSVVAALICSVYHYLPSAVNMLTSHTDTTGFLIFLEDMFNIVVGIEFIKMLCKPTSENVIEVLIFLVARHLIVGDNSSLGILMSILSVAILYGIRYILRSGKEKQFAEARRICLSRKAASAEENKPPATNPSDESAP